MRLTFSIFMSAVMGYKAIRSHIDDDDGEISTRVAAHTCIFTVTAELLLTHCDILVIRSYSRSRLYYWSAMLAYE